jgi:hypothetical protein
VAEQTSWSIPFDALAQKMRGQIEQAARKIAFEAFSRVIQRSPVDTGRFRANWNVSYGAPNYATTAGTAGGIGEAQKVLTLPVGGVVFLANGLPYAHRLEYGWSKQAPGGMIRLVAAEIGQSLGGKKA